MMTRTFVSLSSNLGRSHPTVLRTYRQRYIFFKRTVLSGRNDSKTGTVRLTVSRQMH